ncbi:hypothetical protein CAter282_1440 [Collimonas arenae]|uniref:Uncharacterized protein n=1 Tax=Collimonas arenae TaxID=279058 RepID=A0A127QGN5_9BURK|nr:hypothetical protein CAter10_1560 [Collimonas arenae]AMP09229.1 hypothetical protein CAter282_1440 [Collimonas arenae]
MERFATDMIFGMSWSIMVKAGGASARWQDAARDLIAGGR